VQTGPQWSSVIFVLIYFLVLVFVNKNHTAVEVLDSDFKHLFYVLFVDLGLSLEAAGPGLGSAGLDYKTGFVCSLFLFQKFCYNSE